MKRAGRKHALLIVATSSGRLFLDRVARQHCPSPLHRHGQTNTTSLQPPSKQEHFYFAENRTFSLALTQAALIKTY